jgi:type II secretory pathway predicted ATPase ExeA
MNPSLVRNTKAENYFEVRRNPMLNHKNYFGFEKEPFGQDIEVQDLYPLPGLQALYDRFLYAVQLAAVAVITGEVGSGKSTSLRYASSKLHPSEYRIIPVLANTGTVIEVYRQITLALSAETTASSISRVSKLIRSLIAEIAARKERPILVIDEAHLLRLEVFAQIHLLTQFEFDSKPILSMVLCGQSSLIDNLLYYTSRPLASRVVGKTHLEGITLKQMQGYINHHLEIAGVKERLFSEEAVVAIQQGSGGLLRRANLLARGALISAASENTSLVSAEHVRIASTEIL